MEKRKLTGVLLGEGGDAFDGGGALEDGNGFLCGGDYGEGLGGSDGGGGEGWGVAEGDAAEGRVKRGGVRVRV